MKDFAARLKRIPVKVQAIRNRISRSLRPHPPISPPSPAEYSQPTDDVSSSIRPEARLQDGEAPCAMQDEALCPSKMDETQELPPHAFSTQQEDQETGDRGVLALTTSDTTVSEYTTAPKDEERRRNPGGMADAVQDKNPISNHATSSPITKTSISNVPSLWTQAISKLSDKDQALLKYVHVHSGTNDQNFFEAIEDVIRDTRLQEMSHRWKISILGREFVIKDVVLKIIEWLRRFKEVGDVAVSFDPVHAALPWAGFRFLLEVVSFQFEQASQILIVLEQIEHLVLTGSIYERLYLSSTAKVDETLKNRLHSSLVDLYSAVLSSIAQCIRFSETGSVMETLRAAASPNQLSNLIEALKNKGEVVKAVASVCESAQQESFHQNIPKEFRRLRDVLNRQLVRMDSMLSYLWEKDMTGDRVKALLWISEIPYESDHQFAKRRRLKGTGEWLLQEPRYREWKDASCATIFWLHGIPGAGKTKLSSLVVDEHLEFRETNASDEGLAYFYCDRNREDHQNPDDVLRSLIRQLSVGHKKEDHLVKAFYNEWRIQWLKGLPSKHLSYDKCKEILPELLKAYAGSTIIIDGLDECNAKTRQELIEVLDETIKTSTSLIKVFISSRDDSDLKRQYGSGNHLQIDASHNQGDIEKYVLARMEKHKLFKVSKSTEDSILTTIREKSQGMFQWAYLHIDELLELRTDSDVEEYLGRLPEGLEKAYDYIWDKIMGKRGSAVAIAMRALRWVMCSWKPLNSHQLVVAVQQDPCNDRIADMNITINIDFVLETCHNLIAVTDEGECRFSHLSVQEYIEKHRFSISQAMHHVGSISILYLMSPIFNQAKPSKLSDNSIGDELPLKDHINSWFLYTREWDPEGPDNHENLLRRFLGSPEESSSFYQAWMCSIEDSHTRIDTIQLSAAAEDCRPTSCLALGIAYLNLRGILRSWADRIDVTATNHKGQSLLHLTVIGGNLEICQELLRYNADPNTIDKDGNSPLVLAADSHQNEMVKLLLEQGHADPNLGGSYQLGHPLVAACRHDDIDLIMLLLQNKAERNLVSHTEWGTLVNAVSGNDTLAELLRKLLNLDVDPSISTERFGTALHAAAFSGSVEQSLILLEQGGVAINAVGGEYGTALNAAAFRKDRSPIHEVLVERGADIGLAAGEHGTPMQCAAHKGRDDIVAYLLNLGADPNYVDDQYPFCPLYLAYKRLLEDYLSGIFPAQSSRACPIHVVDVDEVSDLLWMIYQLDKAGAKMIYPDRMDSHEESICAGIQELYTLYHLGSPAYTIPKSRQVIPPQGPLWDKLAELGRAKSGDYMDNGAIIKP